MGSGEIVEALPLMELGVEELGVVDNLAGKEPVELCVVDAVRPLDFAVESRRRWPDVDVLDAFVQEVPVGSPPGTRIHCRSGSS